jgi:rod shape-determining protein MreD
MKNGFLIALCLVGAFLLQTGMFGAFTASAMVPDLLLVVLVPAAVLWKPIPVAFLGTAAGLMMDILFGHGIGLYAMSYGGISWLIGSQGRRLFHENALIPALMAGAAHAALFLFTALMIYLGRMNIVLSTETLAKTLVGVLLTTGLTIPVYLLMFSYANRRVKTGTSVITISRLWR